MPVQLLNVSSFFGLCDNLEFSFFFCGAEGGGGNLLLYRMRIKMNSLMTVVMI